MRSVYWDGVQEKRSGAAVKRRASLGLLGIGIVYLPKSTCPGTIGGMSKLMIYHQDFGWAYRKCEGEAEG